MPLPAKDFMTRVVHTAKETDSVGKIAKIMDKHRVSCVVILDDRERVKGVMTERDIVRDIIDNDVDYSEPVGKYLSSPVNKVDDDADILILSRYLTRNRMKRLIVMHGGKMVGIVTQTDILRASMLYIQDLSQKLMVGNFDKKTYKKKLDSIFSVVKNLS